MNAALLNLIHERRLSQRALAAKAGLSEVTVSRLVRCRLRPTASTIRKICEALDCNPQDVGFERLPEMGRPQKGGGR